MSLTVCLDFAGEFCKPGGNCSKWNQRLRGSVQTNSSPQKYGFLAPLRIQKGSNPPCPLRVVTTAECAEFPQAHYAAPSRMSQHLGDVERLAARHLFNLLATAEAVRKDERIEIGRAH